MQNSIDLPRAKPRSLLQSAPNALLRRATPSVLRRQNSQKSQLQRCLDCSLKRNRIFFELVRHKRFQQNNTPSWLSQRLNERRIERLSQKLSEKKIPQRGRLFWVGVLAGLSLGGAAWTAMFLNERVTLGGVPYQVVQKFWHNQQARDAFFGGDRQALHDQLAALGVEEDIKDFYRDRFESEYELDRYIHQIMFNRTGYVGEAYEVDNYGRLSGRPY